MELLDALKAYPFFRKAFPSPELEALMQELAALDRDWLTVGEVARIAVLKTSGGHALAKTRIGSTDNDVEGVTRQALSERSPREAMTHLLKLKGVGVATGSAILSWRLPERWPVIDINAWDALAAFHQVEARSRNIFDIEQFEQYCQIVRPLAEYMSWTPRDIDRWLYAFGRNGIPISDL